MDSHELREAKLQGNVPERILDKGACMYDKNRILILGNNKDSAQDLFLFTITEGTELSVKSEVWLKGNKKEAFKKAWSFYKYKDEFYVFGMRMDLESSHMSEGLWKLNKKNGKWEIVKGVHEEKRKVDSKEPERSSCVFHDRKLYVIGLNGRSWCEENFSSPNTLLMLDMESLKWTVSSPGKDFSRNRMTLVGYNGVIYIFIGRSFAKDIETKISGLYRYDQGQDEWVRVEFRGVSPPRIEPQICIAFKESLFTLNPKAESNQAYRIIMDSSESDMKKKSLFMNKDFADVVIKIEEKEFYCNKEILSTSSEFFRELLQNDIQKEICILDVKASTFERFLHWVYSIDMELKEEYAIDLYELSMRWRVEDLKADCAEYLRQNITLENFGRIAQIASEAGEEELFEKATNYGLKNCKLLEENHLEDMSTSVLRKVICKFQKVEQRKKKQPERFEENL